ncbi:hypothetical protein KQI84_05875 [bacterium]|nr:hypothetical protein [bacterium]
MWKLALGWVLVVVVLAVLGYVLTWKYLPKDKPHWRRAAWVVSTPVMFFWLWMGLDELFAWPVAVLTGEIRALPGFEFTAILVGVCAAVVQQWTNERHPPKDRFVAHNGIVLAIFAALIQYMSPLARPATHPRFAGEWKDGVCMQSEGYLCAPASVATLLREMGIETTEEEVCRRMMVSTMGSLEWDMLRAVRSYGLDANLRWIGKDPGTIPTPCMAMVRLMTKEGKPGLAHALTVLDQKGDILTFGDPLAGRFDWDREMTRRNYYFQGIVIVANPQ